MKFIVHWRWKYVTKYTDTDNRRRGQQKTCCAFLIFISNISNVSNISSWYGENGVTWRRHGRASWWSPCL